MNATLPSIEPHRPGKRRIGVVILCSLALAFGLPVATGQNTDDPPDQETAAPQSELTLDERLEHLDPDRPIEYFRLGEDAMDVGRHDLARRLFGLAASLDPDGLGRSACLAIAELAARTQNIELRERMLGVAQMFPAPENLTDESDKAPVAADEPMEAGAMISALLGFYRQGDGSRALRALQINPRTESLLRQYGRTLGSIGSILSYCRSHPRCPTCRNERVIPCPSCRGGAARGHCSVCRDARFILCTTCDGRPGPDLTDEQIDELLIFEVGLLAGAGASWSTQIQLDSGRPRPVLEPAMLARTLDIDPDRTVFFDGEWLTPDERNAINDE